MEEVPQLWRPYHPKSQPVQQGPACPVVEEGAGARSLQGRASQPWAAAPCSCAGAAMSEEIDKTVFKKYEIQTKLGKGVRARGGLGPTLCAQK